MDLYEHILGCLQGTALGDAVGLRREGLSPQRAVRMYGKAPLNPELMLGFGLCSDDTEHTQMVGRALALSQGDATLFQQELARQLKIWLLTVPAGIGLATLKACIRLLFGKYPSDSGVYSAGNGPAMRSALIGLYADSDEQLQRLVKCSTRITHTDPKAEEGALLVARAARLQATHSALEPAVFLLQSVDWIGGDELREQLQAVNDGLANKESPSEFATRRGWSRGVSGYVNQSVPAALYCWANTPTDFRACVENAAMLGGDADTVAAIAGAVCGANVGSENLPTDWLNQITEWPRDRAWTTLLARSISDSLNASRPHEPPPMHWPATLIRNLGFASLVLGIGFRRLLPPY